MANANTYRQEKKKWMNDANNISVVTSEFVWVECCIQQPAPKIIMPKQITFKLLLKICLPEFKRNALFLFE